MGNNKINLNIILIALVIILAIFQVLLLNRYSTIGDKLSNLSVSIEEIEKDNDRLSQKIASASSMQTILVKAKEIGLISVNNSISLNSSSKIAKKPDLSL